VVNANGMTTTSASLPTACVVPVLILQGSMLMDRSVMAMESVRLVTVREILLQVVLVPAKERETKAKAAMHSPAMTLRALMNVNVGPAQILQGSMVMERSVITMENVRLVTVRTLSLGSVVGVLVQEGKGKAKAAIDGMAMTQSALINVNVGPAQILQGRIVMERGVIKMENVRLVTVRDLLLGSVVGVSVQERKGKANAAVGLAMTQSAYINAHAGPAQIGEGSMAMEENVIGRANVTLILVDTGGKVQVVTQSVDDDLKISRLLLAVGYSDVHVYYWN